MIFKTHHFFYTRVLGLRIPTRVPILIKIKQVFHEFKQCENKKKKYVDETFIFD